jgi:iron complex transport system substrate-binding protein
VAPSVAATTTPTATAEPFPIELIDDEGTTVEIGAEPEIIVSLTPAITETLFALGLGDRIVGKSEDVFLYPPEAGEVPDVATFGEVDIEAIVASEPDLVFAGGNFFTPPDAIERMRSLGLTVVVLYAPTVETAFADIELIGDAVGHGAEAEAMADRLRDDFATIAEAVADEPEQTVFYEIDLFEGTIYAPADDSFLAEMIVLAGAEPITTGSADAFDIPLERLIQADPDLILLAKLPPPTLEEVRARPGWDALSAVEQGDVRTIDDRTVTRPGPRLGLGLHLLASTIHPDATIPEPSAFPAAP